MTLAPDGKKAYVAVLGPGNVKVIDTGSHRVTGTVNVGPPGTDPFNIAVTSHAVYVTDQGAGTLTVIDPKTLKVTATLALGNSPYGVAVASSGSATGAGPEAGSVSLTRTGGR